MSGTWHSPGSLQLDISNPQQDPFPFLFPKDYDGSHVPVLPRTRTLLQTTFGRVLPVIAVTLSVPADQENT